MNLQLNEKEMREAKVPELKTPEELSAYIQSLANRPHDYGTCVYAMSLAATAAFNYIANHLGVTGFQASCADLDFLRRTRNIKGPFMLLKVEDALYPQYNLPAKLEEFLHQNRFWLRAEALKNIAEAGDVNHDVFGHWIKLAGELPTMPEEVEEWNKCNPDDQITDRGAYLEVVQKQHEENFQKWLFLNDWHADQTERFVEENHPQFLRFGISKAHLFNRGSISKADSVEESGSFRHGMCVSLLFKRNISGVEVHWFEDTEVEGSNGTPKLNIDFEKLRALESVAQPAVAEKIREYIAKCTAKMKEAA